MKKPMNQFVALLSGVFCAASGLGFKLRYEGGTADAPTELWFDYVRPGLMMYIK